MRVLRKLLALLGAAVFGAVVALFAIYLAIAGNLPELQPWHEARLGGEFRARSGNEDLDAYLAREDRLFAKLEEAVTQRERSGRFDRYAPASPSNPANQPRNWNRSFVLEPETTRGAALLLHGLSDSPYSLRAVGELLRARGFRVLGLRLPGHGTLPGELLRVRWRDWRAAVRVGARGVAQQAGPGLPLWLVGYSTGGALAVDYALGALEGNGDPLPSQLVLFSPALAVSPVAALASFQRRLARLPGLSKLAWTAIYPEYDPYKYNSFPVRAGEEIFGLTRELDRQLSRRQAADALAGFPPVLAFQSVVDATILAGGVSDRLLSRLPPGGSALVVFDVNAMAETQDLLRTDYQTLLRSLVDAPALPFELTVVGNASPESPEVVARTRRAARQPPPVWSETPLGLSWPPGVYSLSHVALTFPDDDPLYGVRRADSPLPLGSLELRGESAVFGIPMDQLMRLRHNPFFGYVERRILERLDGAAP